LQRGIDSKPASAAEYLQQFVHEYSNIQRQGLNHNNNQYTIKLSAVVCDMPARTFIKATKRPTGYHGCDKCVQEGVYTSNRMTFPETDAALRTDESFAAKLDEFHHVGVSPFINRHDKQFSNILHACSVLGSNAKIATFVDEGPTACTIRAALYRTNFKQVTVSEKQRTL